MSVCQQQQQRKSRAAQPSDGPAHTAPSLPPSSVFLSSLEPISSFSQLLFHPFLCSCSWKWIVQNTHTHTHEVLGTHNLSFSSLRKYSLRHQMLVSRWRTTLLHGTRNRLMLVLGVLPAETLTGWIPARNNWFHPQPKLRPISPDHRDVALLVPPA